ncbi:hypothetical protein PIB30_027525 [Stylosanthes scabra]|uniref:RING-type E3 ubiquitin transferase n=1 Tax=Stylosanthes scabra TaxID=79078 RepID=A0ABU6SAS1_9FABA|nr:hypothetical protein [Stylosanthes scabra]
MANIFLHLAKADSFLSQSQQPSFFLPHPNPPPPPSAVVRSDSFTFDEKALKVSPSILLIIIILAIVFFVSGLLHLLVRFLWRPQSRDPDDFDNGTALQGQLQQLFHLHDAGVDQSFIDTLPVFHYKAIIGLKNPFDCAVCLCEFEPEDKLRLLPKCSHAFHMDCIDTWLLSHSTCPLCRATLLPDFSSNNTNNTCSPIVLVLESGSETSREITAPERDASVMTSNSREFGSSTRIDFQNKSGELTSSGDSNKILNLDTNGVEKVVAVKLGKFRNVDGGGGGEGSSSSNNNVDGRRCFSMGSFAYVMDESSSLQVPIRTPMKKKQSSCNKKSSLPLTPGHRPAMSECDSESRRDFRFACFDATAKIEDLGGAETSNGAAIGRSRKESFSISKIWLRGKKEEKQNAVGHSSRRAVSFRFPVSQKNGVNDSGSSEEMKGNKNVKFDTSSTISEMDIAKWENGGSEYGFDEESQSCNSIDSQARAPSFARRTLLWLTGRQNKVVHSSSVSNI